MALAEIIAAALRGELSVPESEVETPVWGKSDSDGPCGEDEAVAPRGSGPKEDDPDEVDQLEVEFLLTKSI